jgi:hypothetical protein
MRDVYKANDTCVVCTQCAKQRWYAQREGDMSDVHAMSKAMSKAKQS